MFTSFKPPPRSRWRTFPALLKISFCPFLNRPLCPRGNPYSDLYRHELVLLVLELSIKVLQHNHF